MCLTAIKDNVNAKIILGHRNSKAINIREEAK